ncbi:MAG: hypothetical protein WBG92_11325 [Thiohalocapsa sp.]
MRATIQGKFIGARTYEFPSEETGEVILGGSLFFSQPIEEAEDNTFGDDFTIAKFNGPQLVESLRLANPKAGENIEVVCSLREGGKSTRLHSLKMLDRTPTSTASSTTDEKKPEDKKPGVFGR